MSHDYPLAARISLHVVLCNLKRHAGLTSVRATTSAIYRQGLVRHTAGTVRCTYGMVNYTRRDGTTYAEMLLSRNGTKTGWYMFLAYDVTFSVWCSDA